MHFTKSPLKQKRQPTNATNKMGQYYSNVRVPIKNHNTASVAKRIDKNMTSLAVPDQPTNTNLDDLLNPLFINIDTNDLKNEEIPTIFNYNYNNIITNIAEKTRGFEEEENKNKFKNNININSEISINLNLKTKTGNTFVNMLNQNMSLNNVHENFGNQNTESILETRLESRLKPKQEFKQELRLKPKQEPKLEPKQQIDEALKLLQLTKPTIENVYQERYNNNINASGLGDFIRGSYFLMEFCDNYNIPYNINILNHPVSQFLEIYKNKQPLFNNNVNNFELTNHNPHISHDGIITNIYDSSINDKFIHYLSKQNVFNKKLYAYIIAYPLQVSQKHKEYMKQILQPNMQMQSLVNKMISNLGLMSKNFTIIHIRYGDDFLIKNKSEIKKYHLEMIEKTLNNLNTSQKYLLISDNTNIKNILKSKYPFINIHLNEISHTGEGLHVEIIKLQNTMIDFYLFSHATNVIAFSIYSHGTGFSRWSTETYSVPYICKYLI